MDNISVRDSLQASRVELEAASPEPVAAPEPAIVEAPAEAGGEAEPTRPAEAAAAPTRERDEHGKFLAKAQPESVQAAAPAEAAKPIETAKPADLEPQPEAIPVPPSLSAAVKAQWSTLPPEVQRDISRLEGTVQTAKAEWDKKGQRLNRYDEIIGPQLDKWRYAGLDEFSGIQTLLSAQKMLDDNPVNGIVLIAKSYGLSPLQLAQHLGAPQAQGHEAAPQAPHAADPLAALQPFMQRVQTLEQQLAQQSSSAEAAKIAEARATVAQFAAKPENMYFENVRMDVAKRLESDDQLTLEQAYEQAIWASPEIRPLLLKAQTADQAKQAADTAQRAKASQAKAASGSVTGAPAPGAQAPPGPIGSVRETLNAARQELGARL